MEKGLTGYPIVDAGMRELSSTGWMHNRVRMIVGSFLVKHLLIDWKEGEKYFRNCLLDYSPANNVAGWQWVAGCGADAAPYFRIFNPILQGENFPTKIEPAFFISFIIFLYLIKLISRCSGAIVLTISEIFFEFFVNIAKPKFLILL